MSERHNVVRTSSRKQFLRGHGTLSITRELSHEFENVTQSPHIDNDTTAGNILIHVYVLSIICIYIKFVTKTMLYLFPLQFNTLILVILFIPVSIVIRCFGMRKR